MKKKTLNFKKFIKDFFTNNNTIKVDILAAKFFPKTGIIDFSNIKIEATMD